MHYWFLFILFISSELGYKQNKQTGYKQNLIKQETLPSEGNLRFTLLCVWLRGAEYTYIRVPPAAESFNSHRLMNTVKREADRSVEAVSIWGWYKQCYLGLFP